MHSISTLQSTTTTTTNAHPLSLIPNPTSAGQEADRDQQLFQFSLQLSYCIVGEAIGQVAERQSVGARCARLLAMVLRGGPAELMSELELLVRQSSCFLDASSDQQQADKTERLRPAANGRDIKTPPDRCPVCEGTGKLEPSDCNLVRLKLQQQQQPDPSPKSSDATFMESEPVRALQEWLFKQLGGLKNRLTDPTPETTVHVSQPPVRLIADELRSQRHKTEQLLAAGRDAASASGEPATRLAQRKAGRGGTHSTGPTPALSSEIQRIKRMDTLKCQRLKKKLQRQQQQLQVQDQDKKRNEDPLAEQVQLDDQMITVDLDSLVRLGESWSKCGDGHGVRQSHLPIVEDEEESSSDSAEDRLISDDQDGSWHKQAQGSALPVQQQQGVNQLTVEAAVADNRNGRPEHENTTTPSISYQSIRSSLANLVNGVSQRAQNRKQRLSLKPFFTNMSFASPFSSPVKQQRAADPQQQTTRTTTSSEAADSRKQSSRSQSSGSGSNSQHQPRVVRNSSNCSCLKSSASSQSIESSVCER